MQLVLEQAIMDKPLNFDICCLGLIQLSFHASVFN